MTRVVNKAQIIRLAVIAVIVGLVGTPQVFAGGGNFVPFVAALSGTSEWDGGPVATCNGNGVATHLGRTRSMCSAALDFSQYAEYDVCSGPGETGLGIPNVNTIVLRAANGDRLVIGSLDIACEVIPFRSFHGTGQWTVDSEASTGRFAGASGSGELDGSVDFVLGEVQVSMIGEIDY